MASHNWRVKRTFSDLTRLFPIVFILATGLLQLAVIALMLADWAAGDAPFPRSEDSFQTFLVSSVLTVAGVAGLTAFTVARMTREDIGRLREWVGLRRGGTLSGVIADRFLSWFERRPSHVGWYVFRRDSLPLAFAVSAAAVCMLLAIGGIFMFYDELAWFFPSSAFFLSLPIVAFWLGHGAGRRPIPSRTVTWGLSAGILCAVPAVVVEIIFSRAARLMLLWSGAYDATLLDLIDGAVGAPLVEEGVKATAVMGLVYFGFASSSREGFAAGLSVGLGFAFYENVLYNLSGFEAVSPMLLLRPVNMALHMLGPAILGAAIGGFRWGESRWKLAAGGLAAGLAIHAVWNGIIGALPYISSWAISISGTDQSAYITVLAHLFVTPLLISVALYIAGRRLAK